MSKLLTHKKVNHNYVINYVNTFRKYEDNIEKGLSMSSTAWWKKWDWWLIGAMSLLICLSLIMLLSITIGSDQPYARNQVMFAVVGTVIFIVISKLDYHWLVQLAPIFYAACMLLLVVVAIFAQITRGAASWIDLGPFSLQPSEFLKLALVLFMAFIYTKLSNRQWLGWKLLGAFMVALVLPASLILLQPDFGTTLVIVAAWAGAVLMSPISKKLLIGLGASMLVIAIVGWLFLAPYQQQRIVTFINPAADPLGHGYNVLQSIIAVGSGGWLGQGWGRGTQSHLNFLPEHHTDFIFASLSEELGFVGSLSVLLLYGIIFWRGVRIIWHSDSQYEVMIASGLLTMLVIQTGINVAMNVGLAPVTGIPLPLVSYGGSSLLVTMASLAVIHSFYRRQINATHQI